VSVREDKNQDIWIYDLVRGLRTRFTFDSATNLSYRNEQLSEDRYFMAAMQNSMSDLSVTDHAHSSNSESGKWDFHGDASGSLGFFSASADTNANGSHSGSSTSDFLRQLSTHATASSNQSVQATHASASLSIGEVSTRTHVESQSEDHFESSSREFSNPNHCHAVTFYFYRLLRKQIVKITLEAIERRVDELTARVAAILRRTAARPDDEVPAHLSFGGGRLSFDSESRRFTVAPQAPGHAPRHGTLTPGEAGLLAALARRPGSVLGREQLLPAVTRRPDDVYDRVVDVHVANLRRKLGDDPANPWLIETIPQAGYRLIAARDPA
jgi:hypothetical protein